MARRGWRYTSAATAFPSTVGPNAIVATAVSLVVWTGCAYEAAMRYCATLHRPGLDGPHLDLIDSAVRTIIRITRDEKVLSFRFHFRDTCRVPSDCVD